MNTPWCVGIDCLARIAHCLLYSSWRRPHSTCYLMLHFPFSFSNHFGWPISRRAEFRDVVMQRLSNPVMALLALAFSFKLSRVQRRTETHSDLLQSWHEP